MLVHSQLIHIEAWLVMKIGESQTSEMLDKWQLSCCHHCFRMNYSSVLAASSRKPQDVVVSAQDFGGGYFLQKWRSCSWPAELYPRFLSPFCL